MRLDKNTPFYIVMLVLIFSFISQPVLAASISTAMQIHAQAELPTPMSETSMAKAHSGTCDKEQSHDDCMTHCMYCMSISFILPIKLPTLFRKASLNLSANQISKPASVTHVPAYEPPRFLMS